MSMHRRTFLRAGVAAAATVGGLSLFRAAEANAVARPANLVVNGSTVATVSFESTGTWTAWSTKTLTAALNAGGNIVRMVPTTAAGLPNVDYLDING